MFCLGGGGGDIAGLWSSVYNCFPVERRYAGRHDNVSAFSAWDPPLAPAGRRQHRQRVGHVQQTHQPRPRNRRFKHRTTARWRHAGWFGLIRRGGLVWDEGLRGVVWDEGLGGLVWDKGHWWRRLRRGRMRCLRQSINQ